MTEPKPEAPPAAEDLGLPTPPSPGRMPPPRLPPEAPPEPAEPGGTESTRDPALRPEPPRG